MKDAGIFDGDLLAAESCETGRGGDIVLAELSTGNLPVIILKPIR